MMFARTERLLLRPGWVEDAPALTEAFAREDVVLKLATAPWPYFVDDAVSYLGRDRKAGEADMLIFQRTLGAPRLIGGIGLADRDGDLELGYWIVPSHWGLGFATEAGHAVIAMARDTLRLDRLVSGHFIDNPASGRVLNKLGFVQTGSEMRKSNARDGDVPSITMALDFRAMAMAA
jgi:RimJ/RimL family protein N-acetyltransferase